MVTVYKNTNVDCWSATGGDSGGIESLMAIHPSPTLTSTPLLSASLAVKGELLTALALSFGCGRKW